MLSLCCFRVLPQGSVSRCALLVVPAKKHLGQPTNAFGDVLFHGAFTRAHARGHFFLRQAFDLSHPHDLAALGRQSIECYRKASQILVRARDLLRREFVFGLV